MPRLSTPNYIPQVPTPAQQVFLTLTNLEAFYGGSAGGGKLLDVSTVVLTTSGWSTIGDLAVGDYVFDHNGDPTKVLAKSEVTYERNYELVVNGDRIIAGENHLWNVANERQRANYQHTDPRWKTQRRAKRASRGQDLDRLASKATAKGDGRGFSAGNSESAVESNSRRAQEAREAYVRPSIWDYTTTLPTTEVIALQGAERRRVAIPNGAPLRTSGEWCSRIPPYTLGTWLGDGGSLDGYIYTAEEYRVDLTAELERDGWTIEIATTMKAEDNPHRNQDFHGLKLRNRDGETLRSILKAEGFIKNKHIPDWVFLAPHDDRKAFISGFLDTDGYIDSKRGRIELVLAREDMVRSLWSLLWLMGEKPSAVGYKRTTNQDPAFTGDAWRFHLSQSAECYFRLPYKRDRWLTASARERVNHTEYRSITSIVEVDRVPMQCIQVANPRGLFRVGESGLVTHNSSALLAAALQFVDVPGYAALILRRTFPDLAQPGALMDRAEAWLRDTDAKKHQGGKSWTFPSGARLTFGHVQNYAEAQQQFSSAEFQFIGIDELTQGWDERAYLFLLSRIRRPRALCRTCRRASVTYDVEAGRWEHVKEPGPLSPFPCSNPLPEAMPSAPDGTTLADVPLRMRTASNPGGSGHIWVRERFVDPNSRRPDAIYVPARLTDNPYIDAVSYEAALRAQGGVMTARLLDGDWDVTEAEMFDRRWMGVISSDDVPDDVEWCRYWDLAATAGAGDWTAGALVGIHRRSGVWYVADMMRLRERPAGVQDAVVSTAQRDGGKVLIRMEQEPGSSGVNTIEAYRTLLAGYDFRGDRATGPKVERARPLSAAAEAGRVLIVGEPDEKGRPIAPKWMPALLDELELFPKGEHDDQVDAIAGALNVLRAGAKRKARARSAARRVI